MTLLSALTSISRPSQSNKITTSSNKGSSLLMGSNSVACGSCSGGYPSPAGIIALVDINIDININVNAIIATGSSGSCGCN